MRHKFLRALTAAALTLFSVAPAFALCNPGSPNCITDGGPGSRLAKAKHQVFDPGTFGNCDHNTTLCSDDIAGSSRTTSNPVTPKTGKVVVAPAIR
jgi:hypothetical protein